jgi:hypothetical protein
LSETNERPNKKPLVEDTNAQDTKNKNSNDDDWDLSKEELEILEEVNHGKEIYNEDEESPVKKGLPLETVIDCYCTVNKFLYDIPYTDVSGIRNFKNRKGQHEADFVINQAHVIEAKDWDCIGRGYRVTKNKIDREILPRYEKYPVGQFIRILIIAYPSWAEGAKEYLLSKVIFPIELGFFVTNQEPVFCKAYSIIKNAMDKILGLSPLPSNTEVFSSSSEDAILSLLY